MVQASIAIMSIQQISYTVVVSHVSVLFKWRVVTSFVKVCFPFKGHGNEEMHKGISRSAAGKWG